MTSVEHALKIGVKVGKGSYIGTKNFSTEPYLIEIADYCRNRLY